MKRGLNIETTSMSLHLMAMAFMLCDHLWATVVPGNEWLTCVGRLAFPIFAFLAVEGYFHTHSLKQYVGRLAVFAVISEVPFNLIMASSPIYPFHQNVLWTLLIGILLIHLNEKAKGTGVLWKRILAGAGTVALGFVLGLVLMTDYHYAGIFTILVFYFFRGRSWWCRLGQLLLLAYINLEIIGGYTYPLTLFGGTFDFPQQGLALLALIPIWLYRGKQGPHSKVLQYTYYAFYPVHLLVLWLVFSAL